MKKLLLIFFAVLLSAPISAQVFNHRTKVKLTNVDQLLTIPGTTKIAVIDPVTNEIKYVEVQNITTGAPNLQAVTDEGNSTSNSVDIVNNAGANLQVRNDPFTTGFYVDQTGYLNLVSNDRYFDIDAPNARFYVQRALNQLATFNFTHTSNVSIDFPASSGTLALTSDITSPDLQAVLDTGGYAQADGNNYVDFNLDTGGNGYVDQFFSANGQSTNVFFDNTSFAIENFESGVGTSVLVVDNAGFRATQQTGSFTTNLKFNDPTASGDIFIPSNRNVAGAATLAKKIDIPVTNWEKDSLSSYAFRLTKGAGRVTLTNGSPNITGIGTQFLNESNFDSPFYYYEMTVILPDGSHRYISLDSASSNNAGLISDIYTGKAYETGIGANWDGPTGQYEYYPYMIPIDNGPFSELNIITGYNNQSLGNSSINIIGGAGNDLPLGSAGQNNIISGRDHNLKDYTGNSLIIGTNINKAAGSNIESSIIAGSGSTLEDSFNISPNSSILAGSSPFVNSASVTFGSSLVAGQFNELLGQTTSTIIGGNSNKIFTNWALVSGRDNYARSAGEVSVGMYGTDTVSGDPINYVATDRALNVGVGSGTGARADGLTLLKNGTLTAPELDITEIDGATDALTTSEYVKNLSGWADYVDGTYTDISPFSIVANTDTKLPNDAGTIVDSQKPTDVTTFYDSVSETITGRNGDAVSITIDFKATPTSAGTDFIEVWLDITGGTGTPANLANLYRRIITFPKGNGVERNINFTIGAYTLGTWEANGAEVYVRANGSVDLYDIRYVVARTHRAR